LRAGPRKHNYFDPKNVKAAIVTCGGLCPGLNVVIREIYMSLYYNYGVRDIYGIRYGYKGFYAS
jgi:6-phosphofructokinase 1